jgi:tetratricopeptide (TPR) repeat protein
MASEANGSQVRGFAPAVLPWIVGVVAFMVYATTLNHWVSLYSIGTVARLSGWTWQPVTLYPLTTIVLWPFGLLPQAWIPLALNLFTAACAALVLVLLARTITLLTRSPAWTSWMPQGDQPPALSPQFAWIAPTLAVLACGLQSTFWEHATSSTGETIDLLLFAYIIRCLLEFRNDRNESWLTRAAFLYGAGLTDNWALWLYIPLFLTAVVRMNCIQREEIGYTIRNLRSLLRLGLWGLAGLSLYLLLPTVSGLSSVHHLDFWSALKFNLKFEKEAVRHFFLLRRGVGLLLLATTLPLLAISFRWDFGPSRSARDNLSLWITHATIHVVHAVLLVASLWLMLDPPFSPRTLGYGVEPVGQYYISALVIGYCAGYFLIIGSQLLAGHSDPYASHPARPNKLLGRSVVLAVCILLVVMPVALVARNLSQIRVTNGPFLRAFASRLCEALPNGKCVILSDDPVEFYLVRAEQAARGQGRATLPLDTRYLGLEQYQDFVAHRYKEQWPIAAATNSLGEAIIPRPTALLSVLSTNQPMVYLHPSFDYCFDQFTARAAGPVLLLLKRPADGGIGQKLDPEIAVTNELYWQQQWTASLQALARQTGEGAGKPPEWAARSFAALHLVPEPNRTAAYLGAAYAKWLNYWGVQMQGLGHWTNAEVWFQRGLELKSGNLSARINLEYNRAHQRGDASRLNRQAIEAQYADLFAEYRFWELAAKDNGPVDEPTFLSPIASALWAERNFYQAAEGFLRCTELAPDWLEPQLGLLESYVVLTNFAQALSLAEKLSVAGPPVTGSDEARLMACRAKALAGLDRPNEARSCIDKFVRRHPEQPQLLSAALPLYLEYKRYVEALNLANQLLSRDPNNTGFLECKGLAQKELWHHEEAIATFTQVLELDPSDPAARINRASTYLRAGRLEEAHADYELLFKDFPTAYQVLYGLADIAARKNDTNAAIEFYQRYLVNGIPQTEEYKVVAYRLKHLQGVR